jgi:hypothetical protein
MSVEDQFSGSIDGIVFVASNGLIIFLVYLLIRRIRGTKRTEITSNMVPKMDDPYLSSGYLKPAGWLKDPSGEFDQRYWNGTAWTNRVKAKNRPNRSTSNPRAQSLKTNAESAGADTNSLLQNFERLAKLHQDGIITDEEFSQTKKRIIDSF